MPLDLFNLENNFNGYWHEGEKCRCTRTHWVIHDSKSNCWECMHDPCACILPLVWDISEQAYYRCFLSTDGKTKKKIWMSKPIGSMATINFNGGKKKRKERDEKEREEEDCAGKDQSTQKHGYCCHQHAKVTK